MCEGSVSAGKGDGKAGMVDTSEQIEGSCLILDVLCELCEGDLTCFGAVLLCDGVPCVQLEESDGKGTLKGFGFGKESGGAFEKDVSCEKSSIGIAVALLLCDLSTLEA